MVVVSCPKRRFLPIFAFPGKYSPIGRFCRVGVLLCFALLSIKQLHVEYAKLCRRQNGRAQGLAQRTSTHEPRHATPLLYLPTVTKSYPPLCLTLSHFCTLVIPLASPRFTPQSLLNVVSIHHYQNNSFNCITTLNWLHN